MVYIYTINIYKFIVGIFICEVVGILNSFPKRLKRKMLRLRRAAGHHKMALQRWHLNSGTPQHYGPSHHSSQGAMHAGESFPNLVKSNRNRIVFTIFRLIWNQTDVRLFPNQSENGKYNLISS